MQRRHFLKITTSGGFALSLPCVTGLLPPTPRPEAFAHPELLTIVGGEQQLRAIGRAYRARFPQEDDSATLVAALTADAGRTGTTLHTYLDRCSRRDFANGDTVQLNGWILALTEARQSALFSLLYP